MRCVYVRKERELFNNCLFPFLLQFRQVTDDKTCMRCSARATVAVKTTTNNARRKKQRRSEKKGRVEKTHSQVSSGTPFGSANVTSMQSANGAIIDTGI